MKGKYETATEYEARLQAWANNLEKWYGAGAGVWAGRSDIAQARCLSCGVRHTWPRKGGPRVSEAKCPTCGVDMFRTTYYVKCAVRHWPHGLGVLTKS